MAALTRTYYKRKMFVEILVLGKGDFFVTPQPDPDDVPTLSLDCCVCCENTMWRSCSQAAWIEGKGNSVYSQEHLNSVMFRFWNGRKEMSTKKCSTLTIKLTSLPRPQLHLVNMTGREYFDRSCGRKPLQNGSNTDLRVQKSFQFTLQDLTCSCLLN